MKQVTAIIRMNRMNATKTGARSRPGSRPSPSARSSGAAKATSITAVISGAEAGAPEAIARLKDDGPMLIPKRMMNLVVPDESVPKSIETVIRVNHTGNRGDGKIFVLPVEDAVRVRTGEHGPAALS